MRHQILCILGLVFLLVGCSNEGRTRGDAVYGAADISERRARVTALLEQLEETRHSEEVQGIRDAMKKSDSLSPDAGEELQGQKGWLVKRLDQAALKAECEYLDNLIKLLEMSVDNTLTTNTNRVDPRFPEFSWDTIPRYMHVYKATAFTSQELKFLASFPLITFEKAQGPGSVQAGTRKAARGVKRHNPKAKILYYKNIIIDWQNAKELESIPDGYVKSLDGSYPVVNPNSKRKFFDISNPAVRDWWIGDAGGMLDDPAIDGVFIDANIKVLHHRYFPAGKKVGEAKAAELRAGYETLLKRIDAELRPKNLVLANIIRARLERGGLDYLEYFDGSYLEGFEHNVDGLSRVDYIAKGIAYAQDAARQGKILALTVGLGEAQEHDSSGIGLDESRAKLDGLDAVEARLNYIVAMFLVIAEKYSYVYPHDGYGVPKGANKNKVWMADMPIFRKRLGPPRGPATQDGYVYTREFAHCSVRLDIENQTGVLTWK